VQELRRSNEHVAVVGDLEVLSQLADIDVVRISLTPEQCLGHQHADLIALHSEPQRLDDLLRVLHETRRPGLLGWTAILACNTLAISGAFLAGLTSLHVVALTNVGVLTAGLMCEGQVRRSRRLLSAHGIRKQPTALEAFALMPEETKQPTPDLKNPALQPVVPRHGPKYRPRERNVDRLSSTALRQSPPPMKLESLASETTLVTTNDKTSPHRSG